MVKRCWIVFLNRRGSVTCNHWLSINQLLLISYCHWLIFAQITIFILNDNWFFLHNPMSFNWFILMNILKSAISFHIGSHSRTFGTVWQHRQVPPLITDKLSLLVNCRVKLTGTPREEYIGSVIPALKPSGSPAPSSRSFRLAVCRCIFVSIVRFSF